MKRLIFSVSLLVASITAAAQSLKTDWNHGTDFSKYKTYAWLQSKNPAPELANKRVIEAVDAQLVAKGLRKVEGEMRSLI